MGESMLEIAGFRRERGLLWPAYDTRCAEVTFAETEVNMAMASAFTDGFSRRSVIQAGGNCGQLVRELADMFNEVYTFEPDARNFVALTVNTAEFLHVHRFQAALDNEPGLGVILGEGDTAHAGRNCGALFVANTGPTRTMRIDDLGLKNCDLIFLDVEGSELRALVGGEATIRASQPTVIFESKGHGTKFFGEDPHAAEKWLEHVCGYVVADRTRLDTVMVPR